MRETDISRHDVAHDTLAHNINSLVETIHQKIREGEAKPEEIKLVGELIKDQKEIAIKLGEALRGLQEDTYQVTGRVTRSLPKPQEFNWPEIKGNGHEIIESTPVPDKPGSEDTQDEDGD